MTNFNNVFDFFWNINIFIDVSILIWRELSYYIIRKIYEIHLLIILHLSCWNLSMHILENIELVEILDSATFTDRKTMFYQHFTKILV